MQIRYVFFAAVLLLVLPAIAHGAMVTSVPATEVEPQNQEGGYVPACMMLAEGDCDADGIPNERDNCPFTKNGDCSQNDLFCDPDQDGTVTALERSVGRQKDTDLDSVGDACTDDDDDGVMDYLERDSDGDGFRDDSDNCPTKINKSQADEDDDGIGDACDDCWDVANADQADSDHDGIGDACEETSGGGYVQQTGGSNTTPAYVPPAVIQSSGAGRASCSLLPTADSAGAGVSFALILLSGLAPLLASARKGRK